jgi:hypothetical protein
MIVAVYAAAALSSTETRNRLRVFRALRGWIVAGHAAYLTLIDGR